MKEKFLVFFLVIYGFLLLGYLARRLERRLSGLSKPLLLALLVYILPVVIFNAFWSIDFSDALVKIVPFVYVAVMTLSIFPALIISRAAKLGKKDTGSLLACALFSNVGLTLGGFLCYLFYGGRGLYLSNLYTAFFTPYYYFVGFPLMSGFSDEKKVSVREAAAELLTNPASVVPLAAMAAGLALNIAGNHFPGLSRPRLLDEISNRWLTYVIAAGNSFAIGLGFSLSRSLKYVRHALLIAAIKFAYTPLTSLGVAFLLGFNLLRDPVPAKVILVESFMPTAIMSLVLVKIFDLNDHLANSAWILGTLLIIPLIPIVYLVANLL